MLGKYNGDKLSLEQADEFVNLLANIRGVRYWNAPQQFECVKRGLCALRKKYGSNIVSMGIDTMGCNFAFLDRRGELIGEPYYTRVPQRPEVLNYVFDRISPSELFSITGMQTAKLNTLYHLAEMKMQNSPLLAMAHTFLMVPDLLNYWLTGETVSEYTTASTTDLLDAAAQDWSRGLLERLQIDAGMFPEIVNTGTELGALMPQVAHEVGLNNIKVIEAPMHDTASALLTMGNESDNNLFFSIGTWAILGTEVTKAVLDTAVKDAGFANEGAAYKNIRLVYNSPGTSLLRGCAAIWGGNTDYGELAREASRTPGISTYLNLRNPEFLTTGNMVGAILKYCARTSQTPPKTRGEYARTITESIAMSCKNAVSRLIGITGQSYSSLTVMGGGGKDEFLCQCIADALNIRVVAGPSEASSIGNIIAQLKAGGEIKTASEIRELMARSFPHREYEPQNPDNWDAAYASCMERGIYDNRSA